MDSNYENITVKPSRTHIIIVHTWFKFTEKVGNRLYMVTYQAIRRVMTYASYLVQHKHDLLG